MLEIALYAPGGNGSSESRVRENRTHGLRWQEMETRRVWTLRRHFLTLQHGQAAYRPLVGYPRGVRAEDNNNEWHLLFLV